MTVAIVLPARDEADAIGPVVRGLRAVGATPIVVDNGSRDGTGDVARAAGAEVVFEREPGYGAACLAGLAAALRTDAALVGFMDADGSDPPEELPRLLAARGDADGVLGTRPRSSAGGRAMPRAQRFGNWFAPTLLRVLVGAPYTDMPSFKVLRREALAALDLRDRSYGFTIELLVRAHARGLVLREVPIAYRPRAAGVSKVSGDLRASVRAGVRITTVVGRYAWDSRHDRRGGKLPR